MLPIEPGCLAIVINSYAGNNGITVTVGKFIGEHPDYYGHDRWEVDRPLKAVYEVGEQPFKDNCFHARECQLLRIDGGDFEEEGITVEQLETFSKSMNELISSDFEKLKQKMIDNGYLLTGNGFIDKE